MHLKKSKAYEIRQGIRSVSTFHIVALIIEKSIKRLAGTEHLPRQHIGENLHKFCFVFALLAAAWIEL